MNLKIKTILTVLLLLAVLVFAAGCSDKETPYQINDAEGYTVSVKFDANGGYFATNTYVIVDSYNISELKTNSQGKVEIALLSPDNEARGKVDAYEVQNPGYFLAGWYEERIETDNGYTYSGKWDFETDRLAVDPSQTYTSEEPQKTLYAVWGPKFSVEFYDKTSGEQLGVYEFNPIESREISVPAWDPETGAIEMYKFPAKDGCTFNAVYYDAADTEPITDSVIVHPGQVDPETGAAKDPLLKLYVDWTEGEWYHIYNAKQLREHASVSGNYVICDDIDFADQIWPTSLMHGNFTGTIVGNGHTISNVNVEQTDNSKTNAGLFGALTENASITDLHLENITVTIKAGTRVAGTSYGLLAGTISENAVLENISIANSRLLIHSGSYFGTDDYVIGLLCGMGSADIDISGITCETTGDPDIIWVIVNDGEVVITDEAPADAEPVEEDGAVEETVPAE